MPGILANAITGGVVGGVTDFLTHWKFPVGTDWLRAKLTDVVAPIVQRELERHKPDFYKGIDALVDEPPVTP